MLYTGLDVHCIRAVLCLSTSRQIKPRSFSYITTMNDKGQVVGQKKLPCNGEVVEFLKEFDKSMEVAIEASPIMAIFPGPFWQLGFRFWDGSKCDKMHSTLPRMAVKYLPTGSRYVKVPSHGPKALKKGQNGSKGVKIG